MLLASSSGSHQMAATVPPAGAHIGMVPALVEVLNRSYSDWRPRFADWMRKGYGRAYEAFLLHRTVTHIVAQIIASGDGQALIKEGIKKNDIRDAICSWLGSKIKTAINKMATIELGNGIYFRLLMNQAVNGTPEQQQEFRTIWARFLSTGTDVTAVLDREEGLLGAGKSNPQTPTMWSMASIQSLMNTVKPN